MQYLIAINIKRFALEAENIMCYIFGAACTKHQFQALQWIIMLKYCMLCHQRHWKTHRHVIMHISKELKNLTLTPVFSTPVQVK